MVQRMLKVGGKSRRSERVKANQKERPDSVQDPETVQELDNIPQIEYPRVARRVARVPEARGGLKGEGERGEVGRHESKRGRWLEDGREQKPCLLWFRGGQTSECEFQLAPASF